MVIVEAFVAEDEDEVVSRETLAEDVVWVNGVQDHGYVKIFIIKVCKFHPIYYHMMRKIHAREIL